MDDYSARLLQMGNLHSLAADVPDVLYAQAVRCIEGGEYDDAVEKLERLLKDNQADRKALDLLFSVYFTTGRPHLALLNRKAALTFFPDDPEILNDTASCHYVLWEFDKAVDVYERVLRLQPDNPRFLSNLVTALEGAIGKAHLSRLRGLHRSPECKDNERVLVCFALAQVEERNGNSEVAFRYYEEANRLAFKAANYNEKEWLGYFDMIEEVFTPELFARLSGVGNMEASPIFVFGMGRSGTSLVEQILSAHPKVHGAGEADIIPFLAEKQVPSLGGRPYPQALQYLQPEDFASLAATFLKRAHTYYPTEKPYIAVKTLYNFFHTGFIRILFPRAILIHCRRDPMDNCWSLYKSKFTGHHPYCYDQETLGRHYRRYQKLMEHWHHVMPGHLHDVQYEELVKKPKKTIAALLDHCGLPWADECIEFYRHRRPVMTSSTMQVQRPLYTTSINSWRKMEKELEPLRKALGEMAG